MLPRESDDEKGSESDAKYTKMEVDWVNSQANVAILESHLKRRKENERLLAAQVNKLAVQLAETTAQNQKFSQKSWIFYT